MPHLAMEYSANLDEQVDFDGLCAVIRGVMAETGLFEVGGIRVRALQARHYAIADTDPRNGFIDMVLRIGTGRSAADRKRAGDAIFAAAAAFLAPLFESPHFALSFEIREIDAELSWKKNSMHARLRGK